MNGRTDFVLVAAPGRVGIAGRMLVLSRALQRLWRGTRVRLVTGEAARSCFAPYAGEESWLTWRAGDSLGELLAREPLDPRGTRLVLVDLAQPPLACGFPRDTVALLLESWPPRRRRPTWFAPRTGHRHLARSLAACTGRRFFCGAWPLITSPEERVALAPHVERLEPWSGGLLEADEGTRPSERRAVLVFVPGGEQGPWREAARRVIGGGAASAEVLISSCRGAPSPEPRAWSPGVLEAGPLPDLLARLARGRAALVGPSLPLLLACRASGTPVFVVSRDEPEWRCARYLTAAFGGVSLPPWTSPETLLERALEPPAQESLALVAAERAGQERAASRAAMLLAGDDAAGCVS
ncbi:MAG: hypothetical protein AB1486_23460 [Planctomycetota bacterium]